MIGLEASRIKPFTFKDTGKFERADYSIIGKGVTHTTKDKEGNLIVHWDLNEILPNFGYKKFVGKCLIYEIVDPNTHIIKGWGFDKGGNPQSCRVWP